MVNSEYNFGLILVFLILLIFFLVLLYTRYQVNDNSDNSKLELYYTLEENGKDNADTINLSQLSTDKVSYYGIQYRYMSDSNYLRNKDIVGFLGFRSDGDKNLNLPSLYNETIEIKMESGAYLKASTIYTDSGKGFQTEGVEYIDYAISGKTGIFNKYYITRIYFDNVNKRRRIVFI